MGLRQMVRHGGETIIRVSFVLFSHCVQMCCRKGMFCVAFVLIENLCDVSHYWWLMYNVGSRAMVLAVYILLR